MVAEGSLAFLYKRDELQLFLMQEVTMSIHERNVVLSWSIAIPDQPKLHAFTSLTCMNED